MLDNEVYSSEKDMDDLFNYVTWEDFVDDGIVRLKDGSLMAVINFRGRDLDSSTDMEMIKACAAVDSFFSAFGTGWGFHIEAQNLKARDYPDITATNPAARIVDEEMCDMYNASSGLFERAYHMSITYTPPTKAVDKMEKMFWKKQEIEKTIEPYKAQVNQFKSTIGVLERLLRSVMESVKKLDCSEILSYLQSLISTLRLKVNYNGEEGWPFAEYLSSGEFVPGSFPRWVDPKVQTHIRVISVKGYPEVSYPGFLDAMDKLCIEYRFVHRFACLSSHDSAAVYDQIWKRREADKFSWKERATQMLNRQYEMTEDPVKALHAAEAKMQREDVAFGNAASGYLTTSFVVWDKDLAELDKKVNQIEEVLISRGFSYVKEMFNCFFAFLGTLPGEMRCNARKFPIPSIHMVHMMPISAIWSGPEESKSKFGGPALMHVSTDGNTPFRLDLYNGENGNTLIIGPPRTGKSTFLATACMLALARYKDPQVFCIDVDSENSTLAPACLAAGGDVMSFEAGSLALQPFADVDQPEEREWAAELLELIFNIQGIIGKDISLSDAKHEISKTLEYLATEPKERRTVSSAQVFIQNRDMKRALAPYCGDGLYAHMIDAKNDRIADSHWNVFELTALLGQGSKKKSTLPVLETLLHKIFRKTKLGYKQTLLVIDEAWLALRDIPEYLDGYLRRFPKYGGSVILATHGVRDTFGPLAGILKNTTKIFLPDPTAAAIGEEETRVWEELDIGERKRKIIASGIAKRDFYIIHGDGCRLGQLELGPRTKALCGSGGSLDRMKMQKIVDEHGRENFLEHWLEYKGVPVPYSIQSQGVKYAAE